MKYLWHAFFARPDIPLLRLPWNAFAMVTAAVAGFWDPAIWGVATAGELVYLFTMASNPGFQNFIDERKTGELRSDTDDARKELLSRVGGASRQRYVKLEEKRQRLDALYKDTDRDDLLADSNREAVRKLTWLYLSLLVAQRNLIIAPSTDERDLQSQIKACERALVNPPSSAAQASTEATLRLLRERMGNIQHKSVSLAEIDADLARIETQFDFALEEATLRGRPVAISANVELTSRLLANLDESSSLQADQSSSGRLTE